MKRKILALIIIAVVILAGALYFGFKNNVFQTTFQNLFRPSPKVEGIVLFYGEGCPHCQEVEKFIAENKVEEKVKFTKLRVPLSEEEQKDAGLVANAQILLEKSEICGINTDDIGVPFLWDGSNCFLGYENVNNFFKEKIK